VQHKEKKILIYTEHKPNKFFESYCCNGVV